jgi:hypothetical protein
VIGPIPLHPCQARGIQLRPRTRLAQTWLRGHRHHPHLPPHAAHPFDMDLMALVTPPGGHAPHPIQGATRLRLIEPSQQVQMLHALVYRLVVPASAVHPEPLAWPPHAALFVVRFEPGPPLFKQAIHRFF